MATRAATTAGTPERTATPETLAVVRPAVRELLVESSAFRALPAEEQRRLANDMVKVASYLAEPEGVRADELATQMADGVDALKEQLGQDPGFAGEDFVAGATRAGTEEFGHLVDTVDFPTFVSSLIQGTFQAIVDSSIQQMEAYGELLANVAKSLDDYARDNVTPNNARDWLVDQFPDVLEVQTESTDFGFAEDPFADGQAAEPQPRIATREDAPEDGLARIRETLQLAEELNLDEPASEAELVRQAQLQIARGRQQLLASMVMLGINRIVVTDGLINAKVIFQMAARDIATRGRRASLYDRERSATQAGMSASYGSWFSPVSARAYAHHQREHVTAVSNALDETSDSRSEVKAKLSGEVRVNFKSDYFPLEKLATPQMIGAIQGTAVPTDGPPGAQPDAA